jgi:WD40 repeat protein
MIRLRTLEAAAVREMRGHTSAIHCLDSAPGVLLSAGGDGVIKLWDTAQAQPFREIKHGASITAAALRPDAKRLASAGPDGTIRLWDPQGKLLAEGAGAHDARLRHAAAQRSATIAAGETAYRKALINDLTTQQKAAADRLKKAQDAAASAAKSLAEKQTASTAASDVLTKAEQEKKPEDALKPLRSARDSAASALAKATLIKTTADDELALATKAQAHLDASLASAKSAAQNAELRQQQAQTAVDQAAKALADSKRPIHSITFSPDNLTLAACDDQGAVHTFSAETGAPLQTIRTQAVQATVTFLDGNRLITAASRSAHVHDLNPQWKLDQTLGTADQLSDRVTSLAFSRDARLLAAGSGVPSRSGQVLVWTLDSARPALHRRYDQLHSDTVLALDFSPDASLLASASADRFARVTDLATSKVIAGFEGHTHHVQGVAFKSDSRTLATAGADNLVKLWDLPTASRRRNIAGFTREVTSVRFVPASDQLLASSADGRLRLLTEAGADVRPLAYPGGSDFLYAAAVSADGSTAISAGAQGVLRAWNLPTGQLIAEFNTINP